MSNLIDVANAIGENGITVTTPFRYATICERRPTFENPNYTTASCMVLPTKYQNMQDIIAGLVAKDAVFSCNPNRRGQNWFDLQLCYDNCVIIIELHNYVQNEAKYWCSILDVPAEGIEYCLTNGVAAYFGYLFYARDCREASWDEYMDATDNALFRSFDVLDNTSEMSSYEINAWVDDKFGSPSK